jgi:hypothetical protein
MILKMFRYIKALFYARIVVPYRYIRFSSKIEVRNGLETIDYIIENHASVSRYGDYEFMSIQGEDNNFNLANLTLSKRLKEVLNSDLVGHIICIPHAFHSVVGDNLHARIFWKHYIAKNDRFILSVIRRNKVYYDASFTRFYMDSRDKSAQRIQSYVDRMKKIWNERDVYVVEGENSRFGVGNDLLDNVKSLHRILCPSTNAFEIYDEILNTSLKLIPKDGLVLCVLGMTATVLSYDLAREGYQAIDMGHADVEYSWFKMGASAKVAIPGKAVNEVGINEVGSSSNEKYLSEVLCIVK